MVLQFARNLALIAFAAVSLGGILAHSDFEAGIRSALIAGALFYILGLAIGEAGRRVVEESAEAEVRRLLQQDTKSKS